MAYIERRSETSWRISVSNGYDSNGKKLLERKTVEREPGYTDRQWEKELEALAVEFEREVKRGTVLDGNKITFSEFIDRWLTDYAEKQLELKTLSRYKDLLERIVPALGHIKLNKLQPTHFIQFYNNLAENGVRNDMKFVASEKLINFIKTKNIILKDLADSAGVKDRTLKGILAGKNTSVAEDVYKSLKNNFNIDLKFDDSFIAATEQKPLSNRTILHHHRLISSILTTAVQWQVIFSNPAERLKAPKVEKKEASHYEEETVEALLDLLEKEPIKYKTMTFLTVLLGLRRGELCGLEWTNIDLEDKKITICKSSQYIPKNVSNGGLKTKKPKNETSERVIAIPELIIDILKEYKIWQNEEKLKCGDLWSKEWEKNPRLFVQWNGKPIFPDTITKWFQSFRNKNNLPDLTVHGLRHTNATLLIGQGVDVRTISNRLGHARTSTTTDIYSHALKRPDKEVAEKLDKLFNKKIKIQAQKQS